MNSLSSSESFNKKESFFLNFIKTNELKTNKYVRNINGTNFTYLIPGANIRRYLHLKTRNKDLYKNTCVC